jgi:hypothetical protein
VYERHDPFAQALHRVVRENLAGNGLINPNILRMAKLLGLKSIPPICMSLATLESYVRHYGPLWTNGKGHIVVVAGVDQTAGTLLVYDPWPPNSGKIEWRSFKGWYIGGTPPGPDDPDSSQDTGKRVRATFLYHP